MTSGDLLSLFRVEMNDVAAPQLWSDDFIYGAIDNAQKQFARHTDGIPDSTTSAIVDLSVLVNTDTVALDPRILKIRSARRGDNGRPVEVVNVEDMAPRGWFFDGVTGPLKALIVGMDENQARVWPRPREAVTVKLSVFRMPLVDITDDQPLETPPQHQRALLHWMKHLAYSVQDAETFDKTKAADFATRFENYCADAKADQGRTRHKPRSVAYGGL